MNPSAQVPPTAGIDRRETPRLEPCCSFGRIPPLARFNVCALVAILAAFSLILLPLWEHDPDLTHGLFVPCLFVVLLLESRRLSSAHFFASGGRGDLVATVLGAASLVSLGVAGTYAAMLGWSHALVQFLLAASVLGLLGMAWLALADGKVRWIPVSWSAGVGIVLWLLAAPLPPGAYSALSLLLQMHVTAGVVGALQMAGIPAHQEGNVIELARLEIGVSEACSGVRSLISCLAAGLFFSAVFTTRARSRLVILLAAPLTALGLNFIRSLLLALMASRGISIAGTWHDATGFSIITLGTGFLALLAWRLRDRAPQRTGPALKPARHPSATRRQKLLTGAISLYGVLAVGLLASHLLSTPSVAPRPPIDLERLLPPAPPGWQVGAEPDLSAYASILRTGTLASRTYWCQAGGKIEEITFYLAYWQPGQAPVSLVAAHTPDACWPGTGWETQPVTQPWTPFAVGARRLPEPHSRIFTRDGQSQYVWFWHLYGGRPVADQPTHAAFQALSLALRYGFAPDREQLFVRVSSNRPWREIGSSALVQKLFAALNPLGL